MKNRLIIFLSILLSILTTNVNADYGGRGSFRADCPEDFPDCAGYIGKKLTSKFYNKYSGRDWRIVVPLASFFVLGNGTIKGHFSLAILPDTDRRTTEEFNSLYYDGQKPKKSFTVNKNWPEILEIGGEEFSEGKRFNHIPDERVYRAKRVVYVRMLEEAITEMMSECENSEGCDLYQE